MKRNRNRIRNQYYHNIRPVQESNRGAQRVNRCPVTGSVQRRRQLQPPTPCKNGNLLVNIRLSNGNNDTTNKGQ